MILTLLIIIMLGNFKLWPMCTPKKYVVKIWQPLKARIQSLSNDSLGEMLVRRFLHANGFRYKLHDKSLPGKPDIVLPKYKTVIFVHGCFWHGHEGCKYYVAPKTRTEWWLNKINGNIAMMLGIN